MKYSPGTKAAAATATTGAKKRGPKGARTKDYVLRVEKREHDTMRHFVTFKGETVSKNRYKIVCREVEGTTVVESGVIKSGIMDAVVAANNGQKKIKSCKHSFRFMLVVAARETGVRCDKCLPHLIKNFLPRGVTLVDMKGGVATLEASEFRRTPPTCSWKRVVVELNRRQRKAIKDNDVGLAQRGVHRGGFVRVCRARN